MARRTYEAGEITRSENLQRNEKIKALSGMATKAGLGLVVAGVARAYLEQVDGHAIFWSILGAGAIWSGMHVLTLLEADS